MYGPLSLLCWLLKPVNILIFPLSILTGILTLNILFGIARYSRMPLSVIPKTSQASLTCLVAFANGSDFTIITIKIAFRLYKFGSKREIEIFKKMKFE